MIDLFSRILLILRQAKLLKLKFNQLIELSRHQGTLKFSVILQVIQIVFEHILIVFDEKFVHLAPT
jgi:hypothetical protein